MKRYLKIYKVLVKRTFIHLLSHRFNVFMTCLTGVIWTVGQLLSVRFLYTRIDTFEGWRFEELILLLAFGQVFVYINFTFYFENLNRFAKKLLMGEFDRYLTYPLNTRFL